MRDEILASRYAKALINSATEEKIVDEIDLQSQLLLAILSKHPKIGAVLCHPAISFSEKSALLDIMFKQTVFCAEFKSFIYLLVRKKRFYLLCIINELFKERVLFLEKKLSVSAYTAKPLLEKDRKLLIKKLTEKFEKNIDLYEHIDSSLIGGLKIKVGHKIFDASIKRNLELFGTQLQG